jgi:hypothetical protein
VADSAARGRIVWVRLGPRGDYKKRPAVVLSDVHDTRPDTIIRIMGGTTDFTKPIRDVEVLLPFYPPPKRHPLTKLRKETIVVCDWIDEVKVADILQFGGFVPGKVLFQMLDKMKQVFGTENVDQVNL